jgi:hypothetical protein
MDSNLRLAQFSLLCEYQASQIMDKTLIRNLPPWKQGMHLSLLTHKGEFLHSLSHLQQGLIIYIIRKEKEHGSDMESATEVSRDPRIR